MNSTNIKEEMILDNPNGIHGFKAFNPDWSCTPGIFWNKKKKQYSCPGMFETSTMPSVCNHGMHFCERLEDIFNYYRTRPDKPKVAEVIAWGIVAKRGDKCSTNKLEIVREIPWEEVVARTNSGADCTGVCNTGDWNTGDCNTGNRNTGNRNTGDCNTGDWNTGDCNTGDCNTGNRNTGDWNRTDFSAGCFCTEEPEILMFNKPSGMTLRQWWQHPACQLLWTIPKNVVEWIDVDNMSEEEKKEYPTYETTGGYLKILDERDTAQRWWNGLSWNKQNIILQLPNFDADIFYQCTGIMVGGGAKE